MVRSTHFIIAFVVIGNAFLVCQGFTQPRPSLTGQKALFNSEDKADETAESPAKKLSLEEKMKAWEATEEEVKAATLGGVVPGSSANRADAFDVGLYIAFPLMVVSGLAVALFPFFMGSLDVDGVGPPPTI